MLKSVATDGKSDPLHQNKKNENEHMIGSIGKKSEYGH